MWKIKAVTGNLNEKEKTTVLFACEELKKYLALATDEQIYIAETEKWDGTGIALGKELSNSLPEVADKHFDDAIVIDIKEQFGIITGTNARSVLIAMYRYLREMGFVFIRPGKMGEIIPETLVKRDVSINEKPSYRYRMICIEGSIFYECVEDMIDWIPKVGMNGYEIQFFVPHTFYKRWYDHDVVHPAHRFSNPCLKPEPVTEEEIADITKMHEREIEKRGLIYDKVGHGWHCKPFDIPFKAKADKLDVSEIPQKAWELFAEIDGERKLMGATISTQLCYGNEEVIRKMSDCAVEYCLENRNIDIISFFLADGSNNFCECKLCRDERPSDQLVRILNEIDRKLAEKKLDVKVSFGMYVDRLWPPVKEKLNNPDRFVLSVCPITRTYSESLSLETDCSMKEYVKNRLEFPTTMKELAAYIKGWREVYSGECILWDYYYMWDCYRDLGRVQTSRIIYDDIRKYKDMNMSGLVSCQAQRVFSPTSLGLNIMARTLWNRDCDFETEMEDVFRSEFGEDYEKAGEYLKKMSYYAATDVMRLEKQVKSEENKKLFQEGYEYNKEFYATLDEQIEKHEGIYKLSWRQLKFNAYINQILFEAYISFAKGETNIDACWERLERFVNENEWEERLYFDAFEFKFMIYCMFKDFKLQLQTGNLRNGGDVTDGGAEK